MSVSLPLPLVYASTYQASIPSDHRFPMGKYGTVYALISQRPWFAEASLHQAIPATVQQASLAHDPDYVQRVADGELTPGEVRVIGLPQKQTVRERSFASAGGACWPAASRCNRGGRDRWPGARTTPVRAVDAGSAS